MPHLIAMLLFLLLPGETLVMKSGKKIPCDSYENKDGMLTIKHGEKQFSIPAKLIDWPKTKALNAPKAEKKKPQPKAQPKLTDVYAHRNADQDRDVAVSNDGVRNMKRYMGEVGRARVRVVKKFNVVKGYLAGQGPFDIILDDRAPLSMISQDTIRLLNLDEEGEAQMRYGFDKGKMRPTFLLPKADIANVIAKDLEIASSRMPRLEGCNVVALLGRDFLADYSFRQEYGYLIFNRVGGKTDKREKRPNLDHRTLVSANREMYRIKQRITAIQAAFEEGRFVASAPDALRPLQKKVQQDHGKLKKYLADLEAMEEKGRKMGNLVQCGYTTLDLNERMKAYLAKMLPAQESRDREGADELNKLWQQVLRGFEENDACLK